MTLPSTNDFQAIVQDVLNRPDVQPGFPDANGNDNTTWCNRAVFRILDAIGYDKDLLLEPLGEGYTTANEVHQSLREASGNELSGVVQVDEHEAQELANNGALVIAAASGASHGHVAVVYPSDDEYDAVDGPMVAQAGAVVGIIPARDGFGNSREQVQYFVLPDSSEEGLEGELLEQLDAEIQDDWTMGHEPDPGQPINTPQDGLLTTDLNPGQISDEAISHLAEVFGSQEQTPLASYPEQLACVSPGDNSDTLDLIEHELASQGEPPGSSSADNQDTPGLAAYVVPNESNPIDFDDALEGGALAPDGLDVESDAEVELDLEILIE